METKITISTDRWEDHEVDELIEVIGKEHSIERKELAQFDFGITLAISIGISFAGGIATGIGESIGKDAWEKLKSKFVKRAEEKKHSAISFRFKNEKTAVTLNVKTEDPRLIKKALDAIEPVLEKISPSDEKSSFFFDSKKESWIKTEKRAYMKTCKGIAAATGLVKQGDKTYDFTVADLENQAKGLLGCPITLGHIGKQIGEITKTYVKDGKLFYEGGIYEGTSKEDLDELEKIISSGGGVSMSFSHK